MKKVVSYALWGNRPKYTIGAIINAKQVKEFFPGWIARFYHATDVPSEILESLKSEGAELISMNKPADARGMFWRFEVFSDPTVDLAIIRDTDSRISTREAVAVNEWIESGLTGHILRDHPFHSRVMMGGMWGARAHPFRDIHKKTEAFAPEASYDQDQLFLSKQIYPILEKNGLMVHDSFFKYEKSARDFRTERKNFEFIGEVFDEKNERANDWIRIKQLEDHRLVSFRFSIKKLIKHIQFYLGMRVL